MTHPSVNSIVERLRTVRTGDPVLIGTIIDDLCDEAATIISELQAERDRIERNRDMWKSQCERQAKSLSRIKAETIEALKPFADALQDVDDAARDDWHLWESPAAMNLSVGDLRRANTAIRSLGSTGGAEKTAESGNSPSTHNSESE